VWFVRLKAKRYYTVIITSGVPRFFMALLRSHIYLFSANYRLWINTFVNKRVKPNNVEPVSGKVNAFSGPAYQSTLNEIPLIKL